MYILIHYAECCVFKFVEYNFFLRTSDIAHVYYWISFQHMSAAMVDTECKVMQAHLMPGHVLIM